MPGAHLPEAMQGAHWCLTPTARATWTANCLKTQQLKELVTRSEMVGVRRTPPTTPKRTLILTLILMLIPTLTLMLMLMQMLT
jgi:hypothetical protein